MSKLTPVLVINPAPLGWFEEASFGYNVELKDVIKSWPGSKWLPSSKRWRFPKELHTTLINEAILLGFEVSP